MFTTLYIRQIQEYLYGMRFRVALVITVLVFSIGSVSFVNSLKDTQDKYAEYNKSVHEKIASLASNISRVATMRVSYIEAPRENSVIADCKESVMPNRFEYSAYNVFGFSIRHDSNNPLMKRTETLSWSFIFSMFLSFMALLFSYDAISGEKESRTLSLVFSNAVSRGAFLLSKLLSIITVVFLMSVIGIIISLLILALSGKVVIDTSFLLDVCSFICVGLLLIATFSMFGLLSSVITRQSNVSLLISLCFWLVSAVVIPNTSVFWANKLFPIPSYDEVDRIIQEERFDINKNAPEGSWSSNNSKPFYKRHLLRANNQTNLMMCEKRHKDAYYDQMFRQFEQTRMFTIISPIAQFDYMNEALQGGGYLRFRKNWDDLHVFQTQFLQWFKDIDAKDPESPHWYNPYEDFSTSKKPIEVDQIPQYKEQIASFGQRFQFISNYLAVMIITIAVLFIFSFVLFRRYDIR